MSKFSDPLEGNAKPTVSQIWRLIPSHSWSWPVIVTSLSYVHENYPHYALLVHDAWRLCNVIVICYTREESNILIQVMKLNFVNRMLFRFNKQFELHLSPLWGRAVRHCVKLYVERELKKYACTIRCILKKVIGMLLTLIAQYLFIAWINIKQLTLLWQILCHQVGK